VSKLKNKNPLIDTSEAVVLEVTIPDSVFYESGFFSKFKSQDIFDVFSGIR
jgi:hypothetical protein